MNTSQDKLVYLWNEGKTIEGENNDLESEGALCMCVCVCVCPDVKGI